MYVKKVEYGAYLEVYQFTRIPKGNQKQGRACLHSECLQLKKCQFKQQSIFRRQDNLYRTRKKFVQLVKANLEDSPCLLTLTFVSRVDLSTAFRHATAFFVRLRNDYGGNIKYIYVPEFQKNGNPHFHALVWGLPQIIVENERNARVIQALWGRGYVDCVSTDGGVKLAGYLAKYMVKASNDSRLRGKRAYSTSRNVKRSDIKITETNKPIEIQQHYKQVRERIYYSHWTGRVNYKMYIKGEKYE